MRHSGIGESNDPIIHYGVGDDFEQNAEYFRSNVWSKVSRSFFFMFWKIQPEYIDMTGSCVA